MSPPFHMALKKNIKHFHNEPPSIRKNDSPRLRPTGRTKRKDSIKSKVFEEERGRFGGGKGKLSAESFPFPPPIFNNHQSDRYNETPCSMQAKALWAWMDS